MLVVRAIPLTEPTTEADPTPYDLSGRIALVKSPWKINIEKRIELIQTITNLRAVRNFKYIWCKYVKLSIFDRIWIEIGQRTCTTSL